MFCLFPFLVSARPRKQKGQDPTRKSVSVIFSWLLRRPLLAGFLVLCPSLGPLFRGVSITLFRGEEALSITMQCLRGSCSLSFLSVLSFLLCPPKSPDNLHIEEHRIIIIIMIIIIAGTTVFASLLLLRYETKNFIYYLNN